MIDMTAKSYIEYVGAAAIRSIGSGDNLTIENCVFYNQTTSHLSSCILFHGRFLTIIFCKFQYNELSKNVDAGNGKGTISFNGANFFIQDVWFRWNNNTKGSCINIDGSSHLYEVSLNIVRVLIDHNEAYSKGAGIALGINIWVIRAYISQIVCDSNKAYIGSCLSVEFDKSSSFLEVHNSLFMNNIGEIGGTCYLNYKNGSTLFFFNMFVNNSLPLTSDSGGGVMSGTLAATSFILLFNNNFLINVANTCAGLASFFGQITDYNSKYIYNYAVEGVCLYFQFLSIVNVTNGFFFGNMAYYSGVMSFNTGCTISLTNISIFNLTTIGSGLLFMKEIQGSIVNLIIQNHLSMTGPSLSFIDTTRTIVCENLHFILNSSVIKKLGKIAVFWSSTVKIYNVTANEIIGKGLFDIQFFSVITIENIQFSNSTCDTTSKGCLIFSDAGSKITIQNLIVKNSRNFNSLVYLDNTQGTFWNFSFLSVKTDVSSVDKCLIWLDSSNASLNFFNIRNIDTMFFYTASSNINFISCYFDNGNLEFTFQNYGISFLYIYQSFNKSFINSTFINLATFHLGVIYSQENKGLLNFQACNFENNTSIQGGALNFYFIMKGAKFYNCTFIRNEAYNEGGALYLYVFDTQNKVEIINCSFIENKAITSGGAIFIANELPKIDSSNVFQRNTAQYGNNLASFAIRLSLSVYSAHNSLLFDSRKQNSSLFNIKNEYPGINLNVVLKFDVLDHFNQTTSLLQNQVFYAEISNSPTKTNKQGLNIPKLNGKTTEHCVNGSVSFQNFSVSGLPKSKYFLFITSSSLSFPSNDYSLLPSENMISNTYYYIIPIVLSDCPSGHIIENRQGNILCTQCETGKYTIGMYDNCKECVNGGVCEQGLIYPKPGYWRAYVNTSNIFQCEPYEESCLGGRNSDCARSYSGPLCQTCARTDGKLYSKTNTGVICELCYSKSVQILLAIIIFLIFLIILFVFLKSNLDVLFISNMGDRPSENMVKECLSSAYFKIFLNYLQMLTISKSLDLKWEIPLTEMFRISEATSGAFLKVMNIECLFGDYVSYEIIYFQSVLTSILPFFLLILITFFWLFYAIFKKKRFFSIKDKLILSFVITIFSLQPSIINYLFSIISCKKIDKYYMQSYLTVQCYTSDHYNWIFKLFIPSFTFYAFILPLAAFLYMSYYAEDLHLVQHMQKVGFLSNGYRRKKFYWEFFFFYRKIGIIFISQFFSWKVESKCLIVLLILFLSLWRQAKDNPFISEDLNLLDFKATLFSFCTLFFGLFSYDFIETKFVSIFFMIIVFFLNIFFVLIWLRRILALHKEFFQKPCISRLFKRLMPYIEKLVLEFEEIKEEATRSLSFFEQKKHHENLKNSKKLSLFRSLRSGLSKITSPEYSKRTISDKLASQKFGDLVKTQCAPFDNNKILSESRVSRTESEILKKSLKKTVTFKSKIPETSRDSEREKLYIPKEKPKSSFLLKRMELEEVKLMKEVLLMKDEHIKALYQEIGQLKKEIESQKQEMKLLSQSLYDLQHKTNKIKDVNFFTPKAKPINDLDRIKDEKGYFVQEVSVDSDKIQKYWLKDKHLEVPTPLFSLFLKRNFVSDSRLLINIELLFKHFQNKATLQTITLQASKNLLLNKKSFSLDPYENCISFLLEKVLFLQNNELSYSNLIIESVLLAPDSSLHKIQIILPINDCIFLNIQPVNFDFYEPLFIKSIINKELVDIKPKALKCFSKLLSSKEENLCGIVKITLEGTQLLTLLIEIKEKQGFWVEILLVQDEEINFGEYLAQWVEENLINEFFIPILKEDW